MACSMLVMHKYTLTNPLDHVHALACPTNFAKIAAKNPNLGACKLCHVGLVKSSTLMAIHPMGLGDARSILEEIA